MMEKLAAKTALCKRDPLFVESERAAAAAVAEKAAEKSRFLFIYLSKKKSDIFLRLTPSSLLASSIKWPCRLDATRERPF